MSKRFESWFMTKDISPWGAILGDPVPFSVGYSLSDKCNKGYKYLKQQQQLIRVQFGRYLCKEPLALQAFFYIYPTCELSKTEQKLCENDHLIVTKDLYSPLDYLMGLVRLLLNTCVKSYSDIVWTESGCFHSYNPRTCFRLIKWNHYETRVYDKQLARSSPVRAIKPPDWEILQSTIFKDERMEAMAS